MQLQAFMEEARIDVAEMLQRLKVAAAELGRNLDLDASTIYRHARGKRAPSLDLQEIYQKATSDLVRPDDWLALHKDKSLGLSTKKRKKIEQQAEAA